MSSNFRTIVTPAKPGYQINHGHKLVSIGSCFSENIGAKFKAYKFKVNINPFGQQYNPHSIVTAVERLLNPVPYNESELVFHDELYHSFHHHGSFSRPSVEETLQVINDNLQVAATDLRESTVLFLTFGTSHVFKLKNKTRIVSNCHKLSGSLFERSLLEPAEIVTLLDESLTKLRAVNKNIQIILTVSPVRYFAFGHYENSVSKAHLFTAIYELQKRHPEFYYFPAYELVMDDLRDYRFFAEDMLHPNFQATDYVWESLCSTMLEKKTLGLLKDIDEILLAARHRPRNPQSEAHKQFVLKNLKKMELLGKEYGLEFGEEEKQLSRFLH
jgi:hypothetical protein